VQQTGNASPAMNKTLAGTTTKDGHVFARAPAWMRVNSESVSNEIDESASKYQKHSENRIWTSEGIVIDSREEQQ
jgi:hypothetical protein